MTKAELTIRAQGLTGQGSAAFSPTESEALLSRKVLVRRLQVGYDTTPAPRGVVKGETHHVSPTSSVGGKAATCGRRGHC